MFDTRIDIEAADSPPGPGRRALAPVPFRTTGDIAATAAAQTAVAHGAVQATAHTPHQRTNSQLDRSEAERFHGLNHLHDTHDFILMTMNLQHYTAYSKQPELALQELRKVVETKPVPDIICVQEGIQSINILDEVGYRLLASSGECAQPLRQMLYNDPKLLASLPEELIDQFLVNEVYVRVEGADWEALDIGAERISSNASILVGDKQAGMRMEPLAVRSVVWAKMRHRHQPDGPFVYVFCTQLSGGGAEDQSSANMLGEERYLQVQRLVHFGNSLATSHDLAVLAGDFGEPMAAEASGPQGVKRSPFDALASSGWHLAYTQAQVGPISDCGHLVDYMATSRHVPVTTNVFATANPKDGGLSPATDVPLSDHNFIKAAFRIQGPEDLGQPLSTPILLEKTAVASAPQRFYIGDDSTTPPLTPFLCSCGHAFPPELEFCRSCGARRTEDLFDRLDTNKDGAISREDLRNAIRTGRVVPSTGSRPLVPSPSALRAEAATLTGSGAAAAEDQYTERHAKLRHEREELLLECQDERLATEQLKVGLSEEMRQLHDCCLLEGETIGTLTQKIGDVADAVTGELHASSLAYAELHRELLHEEAQQETIQVQYRSEGEEIRSQIQVSEEQWAQQCDVRESLRAQLRAKAQTRTELRRQIEMERSERTELEVAGELRKEHNDQMKSELLERIQVQRAEIETWRAHTASKQERLRQESRAHSQEESKLVELLRHAREARMCATSKLQSEHRCWSNRVEDLQSQLRAINEECQRQTESTPMLQAQCRGLSQESTKVEEEHKLCLTETRTMEQELQRIKAQLMETRGELGRKDKEVQVKRIEEVRLLQEIQDLAQRLPECGKNRSRRGIFSCFRRRPDLEPPLPPATAPLETHWPPLETHRPPSERASTARGRRTPLSAAGAADGTRGAEQAVRTHAPPRTPAAQTQTAAIQLHAKPTAADEKVGSARDPSGQRKMERTDEGDTGQPEREWV